MLTKIFGSNSVFTLIILVILGVVLWSRMFFAELVTTDYIPVSPFYNILVTYLWGQKIILALLSMAIIIFQAFLMNNLLVENDLLPKKTYLGAFLIILLTASFSEIVFFHPLLFSSLFLTLVMMLVLKLYDLHDGYPQVFNMGMLISLASMFYFPSVIFIVFLWMCFIVYRLFAWREWFISILGLLIPYLFLGTYYYWTDRLQLKIDEYLDAFRIVNFNDFSLSAAEYILVGFTVLLLLISFLRVVGLMNEKAIRVRKHLSLMVWFFIISYLVMVVSTNNGIAGFIALLLPAAVLISIYVSSTRKKMQAEILLIILLILISLNRLGFLSPLTEIF